jgi:hypothetical protein
VSPRVGMAAVVEREISFSWWESNPCRPAHSPLLYRLRCCSKLVVETDIQILLPHTRGIYMRKYCDAKKSISRFLGFTRTCFRLPEYERKFSGMPYAGF